ncbi:MAG: hypothetical protein Q8O34_08725, partial [Rhodocyclaceae bacterium]|nr:hypothetical protein [Rhodocyclaceae bacterium]
MNGELIEINGPIALARLPGVAIGEQVRFGELGPGLLGGHFDGVQRPLAALRAETGDHIGRGCQPPALDRQRLWPFVP